MAKPPTAVMLSFVPTGQLRLYRLGERSRFHCFLCGQDKTAILVATQGGDWERTVCRDCYNSLVSAQRETREAAKQPLVQAKQQPSNKAQPQQPTGNQPPGTTKDKRQLEKERQLRKGRQRLQKERKQLERRSPGIDRLLTFFSDAGIPVRLVSGGCLLINGSQTKPLAWILPPRDALDWDSVIDEMAVKYAGDEFLRMVAKSARFGEGLRAFLRQGDRGIAIMRGDVRLAIIHATSAQIPHRDVIHGNFLKPGPHWWQVADGIRGIEAELVTEWKRNQEARAAAEAVAAQAEAERSRAAARRRIDHLPSNLAPELIAACLDASRRIRLERQVAYERPVVLESGFGELTLLPITGAITRLLMPFRLNKSAKSLKGELVLGDHDPLPLLIGEDVAEEDAITAWTCALLGFADATCIEFEPVEPTMRREPARPPWHLPSSASRPHSSTRTLPRKRWPGHLEPVGHWVEYRGAFVAGHRRRLREGQNASDAARERALQVGIILYPHETWVRPFVKGVPDGIEMRFRWHGVGAEVLANQEARPLTCG
jgi:hypothetical protein